MFYISVQDSIIEKNDSFTYNHGENKVSLFNPAVYKESLVSGLSESLKQQIVDGSMDAQPLYKNERPYFPTTSLHMKLNSRYISKVRQFGSNFIR